VTTRSFWEWLFLGQAHESLPWAQDVWNAIEEGGQLEIAANNLAAQLKLDPSNTLAAIQLRNQQVSILFVRTSFGEEIRESLNILVQTPNKRGGLVVRFVDGAPFNWNRPSAKGRYPVLPRERYWLLKVLEKARTFA
jgi:hypothetical protein